jgi:hypothetical protein
LLSSYLFNLGLTTLNSFLVLGNGWPVKWHSGISLKILLIKDSGLGNGMQNRTVVGMNFTGLLGSVSICGSDICMHK